MIGQSWALLKESVAERGVASNSHPKRVWQVIGHIGHPCWHRRARSHGIGRVHGDAADLERDLAGGPTSQHGVCSAALPCNQPGISGVAGIFVAGVFGDQRDFDGAEQLHHGVLPAGHLILQTLNFAASFVLITVLFAAIYKVVPDRRIEWRDVIVGAVATSFLFANR